MSTTAPNQTSSGPSDTSIRPFRVEIPQSKLDDLRRRIEATRWPSKELVADRSQGVQLATLRELARYWTTEYDWRKAEAKLNALPQFTDRDRRRRHPLHPREVAARERAAADHDPRLAGLGHGAARDHRPADRPDRARRTAPRTPSTSVMPSLPGYGFSGEPTELGWGPGRIAQAWAELMAASATPATSPRAATWAPGHRRHGPPGTGGADRHPHQPARAGAGRPATSSDGHPRRNARRLDALATFRATGFGYFLEQATRPQTIGYALLDSPVALAAWMLDHDTDSY